MTAVVPRVFPDVVDRAAPTPASAPAPAPKAKRGRKAKPSLTPAEKKARKAARIAKGVATRKRNAAEKTAAAARVNEVAVTVPKEAKSTAKVPVVRKKGTKAVPEEVLSREETTET